VSRYITFGLNILLETLRQMPPAAIRWPRNLEEFQNYTNLIAARHQRLHGAFASIDGLNLMTKTSDDVDVENATYNGWLSAHFISSVIVFAPDGMMFGYQWYSNVHCLTDFIGTIISVNFNAPGSWHDARVAYPIYQQLLDNTPDGFYLISDTAFPHGTADIDGRIVTPMKSGQVFTGTEAEIEEKDLFDHEVVSYRQTAEWGMCSIQGSFGWLRLPLPIDDDNNRANLLEICFRLHNLRTRRIGRNEIQSVYMPEWRKTTQEEEIWTDFENMLFSDQQRYDQVARFYNHFEHE
jgi:hypothetical protein